MPAAYQDQFLEQGTTFTSQITLKDDSGVSLNLSSFTIASQAKSSYYTSNVAIVFTASILDSANGIVQLSANANSTMNIVAGKYVYDVKITENETGNVTRILEGLIIVTPSVS